MRLVVWLLLAVPTLAFAQAVSAPGALPRMPDGRPNLQGIWQVRNRASYDLQDHVARHGMPAGRSVVEGGEIPYQPWAAKKKLENFANRATADPLASCYLPGVPRIMYMEWPFQIFQGRDQIAMTFEWTQVHRLIYTDGSQTPEGLEFWMGDSRGRWEGDTLVVDVTDHNDRTWFDMAGNFHSEALKVVERYTLLDADTLRYEATIEDPEGLHQALEDQHAPLPAQGHGPAARVPVPGGGRGSQRRLRARSADLVSAAMSDSLMTITRVPSRILLAVSMLVSLLSIDVVAQAPVASAAAPWSGGADA